MLSIKRLLAVLATIVALTALAPVTSAGSHKEFHLDKTCGPDASEPLGYVCTVQHSTFKWIPAGTKIHYLSQSANIVQATIGVGNGRTNGACTWSSAVDAICVFSAGSGRLTQFNLEVVVSFDAGSSLWSWDGTYRFGG